MCDGDYVPKSTMPKNCLKNTRNTKDLLKASTTTAKKVLYRETGAQRMRAPCG